MVGMSFYAKLFMRELPITNEVFLQLRHCSLCELYAPS